MVTLNLNGKKLTIAKQSFLHFSILLIDYEDETTSVF